MKTGRSTSVRAALLGAVLAVAVGGVQAVDFRMQDLTDKTGVPALADFDALAAPSGNIMDDSVLSFSKNATGNPGVLLSPNGLQRLIRDVLEDSAGPGLSDNFWRSYLRQEIQNWTSGHLGRLGTSALWDHTSLWWLKAGDRDSHRLYYSWTGPQDPQSVPDSASTVALLSLAVVGLAALRQRLGQAA